MSLVLISFNVGLILALKHEGVYNYFLSNHFSDQESRQHSPTRFKEGIKGKRSSEDSLWLVQGFA